MELLKHRDVMFDHPFDRVIYCVPAGSFHQHEDVVDRMTEMIPELELVEGLPDPEKLSLFVPANERKLVIQQLFFLL